MWQEKIQKSTVSVVYWKKIEESSPPEEDKMYLVAINGQAAFAAFRQDGNGSWAFNKDGVTHWAEIPEAPKDAKEESVHVEMES
jgi:hypothetical protein